MDSSENPKSKLPVAVTVASGGEPVLCRGTLAEADGGFVLEFSAGENSYVVAHGNGGTRIKATGILSYEIGFGCESKGKVTTPMGNLDLAVAPISFAAEKTSDGMAAEFSYKLALNGSESLQQVKVTARYIAQ